MPVIGFLNSSSRLPTTHAIVAAFRQGLSETGYVEGRTWRSNTAGRTGPIRSAAGTGGRSGSPSGGRDRRAGSTPSALAAKAATTTIPIVFASGGDPVETRSRRQPQPAGRQRHGRELSCVPSWRRSGWSCCTSWCPGSHAHCRARQSRPIRIAETLITRRAERRLGPWACRSMSCTPAPNATSMRPSRTFVATSRPTRSSSAPIRSSPAAAIQLAALAARHAVPAIYPSCASSPRPAA